MKQTIIYNLITAYQNGVRQHPQIDVLGLGMRVLSFESAEIADCVKMQVEDETGYPDLPLPSHIKIIDVEDDPENYADIILDEMHASAPTPYDP